MKLKCKKGIFSLHLDGNELGNVQLADHVYFKWQTKLHNKQGYDVSMVGQDSNI
jgi:hypothetical protein